MRNRCTGRIRPHFFSGSSAKEAIDDQKYNGTKRCDNNAAQIEGLDFSKTDEAAKKAAEKTANDPDNNRDQTAARILSRHDEFCKRTCNQPEKDPGKDAHG